MELAELYGVQMTYRDTRGRRRESPLESVAQVLRALGAEIDSSDGVPGSEPRLQAAIAARKAGLRARLIEPVIVAWDGVLASSAIQTALKGPNRADAVLVLEDGEERSWHPGGRPGTPHQDGLQRLPLGYHRLHVRAGKSEAEALVISAPRRCWMPESSSGRRWGVFAPLYALRSDRDWGAGDLAELEDLLDRVGSAGGSVVATLPLLATALDHPFDPSPYRPMSRLFWNESYLAVERVSEWESCRAARELRHSAAVRGEIARLRAEPLVDHRGLIAVKRRVLEELARCFSDEADGTRKNRFGEYLAANPEAEEYAAFRARAEHVSDGRRCHESGAKRYHLYCQWQMEEQVASLARGTTAAEVAEHRSRAQLLLDLPVGVHPSGFDVWRWPELFVAGMSLGAPPDDFFAGGQKWESPPLSPDRTREQGHQYFARCVRHHMRYASYLRVDHIMALHRLFCIPNGRDATDGVYVTYPAEELYGVLCLESHRHQTVVVGEDLGTVPGGVRTSMRRHGILSTWVLQSSLRLRAEEPLGRVPRNAVASLGTHDMFPFVGFLRGDDIRARVEIGQIAEGDARRAIASRRRLVARLTAALAPGTDLDEAGVLDGALDYLMRSEAPLVLVNLEDLLLETRPQNLPGTGVEWDSWRRRVRVEEAGRLRETQPAGTASQMRSRILSTPNGG